MPIEIWEVSLTVQMKEYRKTTENDYNPEPAAYEWNIVPIEADHFLAVEELKTTGVNKAV